MDLIKLNFLKSGLTEEEQKKLEEQETAQKIYEKEKSLVLKTMKSRGFKFIVDKIVAETELLKVKLQTCKQDDLYKLQAEVSVRMEFLNNFQPYVD